MTKKSCLNCGHRISGEFCSHCGQKSDTERITLSSLIKSDILGSIWHVESKFFRTLKHVLLNPGTMAINYIAGKRIAYYNLFSLLLILFGFNALALHFYLDLNPNKFPEESSKIIDFFSQYSKTILFSLIPILALNGWILFKRMMLNLAEHVIIASVSLSGILAILLVDDLVSIISIYKPLSTIIDSVDKILVSGFLLFPAFTYYNAFKASYSKLGLFWRLSVFYSALGIEILAIIILLYKIF
ncbi:DUF3667 domain-containing protein [Chryseobacterium soli]|uniref:DUF3667 domain-containing protein n=1 Tax=Chryseobacterium soli TaxID=445961 RepID=A0A086A6B4_9FLAO|nr:DUF3667 domain-containing protein [Chryseobacterium soli]KFF12228.1 hypothetical protein IW15_11755 [Chryseobacterium soli]MDV7696086.1 DUF3667 domain-containing protein [Chryseobacterium soli]